MKTLAATLSHLMSQQEISSAELARKTGIGQPVIYRLMTGTTENPQILTLKPIADFFDVSIDQLLGFASVNNKANIDSNISNDCVNKLNTIKTIVCTLIDTLPALINGYQKAVSENLVKATIPVDILPLLSLNLMNMLRTTNDIQDMINS